MKKLLLAVGLTIFALPAYAQVVEFAVADANGDGAVSVEEAAVSLPNTSPETLAAADADQNGALSQEEYEALASQ